MFSSRTGSCRSYNSMTNLATPFVLRSCFEAAFNTPMNDINSDDPKTYYESHLNITNNDRNCGFDSAYGMNIPSNVGNANPMAPVKMTPWDNRNSLWRRENSVVVGNAPQDSKTESGQYCETMPLYVVDETNTVKTICPVLTSRSTNPQCQTALNTVFQCDRFKDVDPVAYDKCRQYQRMIHYNVVSPDGSFIPIGIEMTDTAFDVYKIALQKASVACASCAVKYTDMDRTSPLCFL
jgi:hypothetical protein